MRYIFDPRVGGFVGGSVLDDMVSTYVNKLVDERLKDVRRDAETARQEITRLRERIAADEGVTSAGRAILSNIRIGQIYDGVIPALGRAQFKIISVNSLSGQCEIEFDHTRRTPGRKKRVETRATRVNLATVAQSTLLHQVEG